VLPDREGRKRLGCDSGCRLFCQATLDFSPVTNSRSLQGGRSGAAGGGRPSLRDTRARLLQAATKVFSAMGYRAASTRAIAHQARINQVTLFRLFEGKARLHAAVIKQLLETSEPAARVEKRLSKPLHGVALIRAAIQAVSEVMFQNPALYRILLYSVLENDAQAMRVIWRAWNPIYLVLARSLDRGMRARQLRRVNAVAGARLIVSAALRDYEIYELYQGKATPRFRARSLSAQYANIIYNGLKRG